MSNQSSEASSPSNSSKPTSSSARPEVDRVTSSSTTLQDFTESPQVPAERTVSAPVIIITGSSSRSPTPEPTRQVHPPAVHSSSQLSQDQHPSTSREQPEHSDSPPQIGLAAATTAMSSASSSPGNTSTAGASSGSSNPSYQLPYAPFPYPMPANARGSGQQSGGQGK
ncbi:hypothetical protein BKA66DRAFT_440205 [Pyrenochaeta sp. MPI-SDFR-AT-0127]|nr:hypothetical protein BKA66DRAFT_440205 [Pyrenochaeta sp. MPI-SDFR-AT-0127]